MNRIQKIAVFNIVIFGVATLTTAIAVTTLAFTVGWPRASAGLAFLAFGGLGGFSLLIFKKDPGAVTCDERDRLINRTAALGGFVASYLWFCLTGTFFVMLLSPELLKKFGLPLILFGGMFVVFIVHSILILVQYGRNNSNE